MRVFCAPSRTDLPRRVCAPLPLPIRSVRAAGDVVHGLYARHLRSQLTGGALPEHVGLIMDGNRRWARQMGLANPSLGHKYGAEHVEDLLRWCEAAGIKCLTVFASSTENLLRRDDGEVAFLMQVIEQVVA